MTKELHTCERERERIGNKNVPCRSAGDGGLTEMKAKLFHSGGDLSFPRHDRSKREKSQIQTDRDRQKKLQNKLSPSFNLLLLKVFFISTNLPNFGYFLNMLDQIQ